MNWVSNLTASDIAAAAAVGTFAVMILEKIVRPIAYYFFPYKRIERQVRRRIKIENARQLKEDRAEFIANYPFVPYEEAVDLYVKFLEEENSRRKTL